MILDREKVPEKILCCKDQLDERNKSGIEKYRKGNFTLKFTKAGKKKISVRQIRHKFLFGSTGFMLGCFESEEKEQKFRELFSSLFNLTVVPLYRIHHEWKTSEEIVTGVSEFSFRGFYGEYEVEVENASSKIKKTINLDFDGVEIWG